jgi:glutamate racemase
VLGLYDSGLGGLTVLAALRAAGIDQEIVYFADQAHVPYGEKTDAALHGYLRQNLALLSELGVDAVVTACNTTCAVAERMGWPDTPFPVLDLIANAGAAFAGTTYRRVGVVATVVTVRSGAYGRALRAAAPALEVVELAAPALVPLVESGDADGDEARRAVEAVVSGLPADLDAVVYGCTHFPLLDRWFARALGERVARIDPALAQAAAAKRLVSALELPRGNGTTSYYTNGDATAFETAVRRWTGDRTGKVAALVAP